MKSERLQKLVEAGVALTSTQTSQQILQKLVDLARDIVGARYSALGVLNADGSALAEFYTSGISEQQRERLAALPVGHGVLGVLIKEPKPVRLKKLADHPMSRGMPNHHPHMESFVGVPVTSKDRVFGNLYCTEKIGSEEFSEDDVALLQMLGAHAAAALENAMLRQERDRFFASAAHELGNAIAGVKLWTQHLRDKTKDAPDFWQEGLAKIAKGGEHAHKLIEDMLSLARIREGRLVLAPWPTDLSQVMHEVATQFKPEAEAAGLAFDTSSLPRELKVVTDPARVRQIVVNLVSNAVKFTPRGKTIHLGAQNGGKDVTCWVQDEGPGICNEDCARIFRPFEQVSGVARGRGTGLGLPLSRQLAQLMGGDLTVDSTVGSGSTFTLKLPTKLSRK